MSTEPTLNPEIIERAITALEVDPLHLPPEVEALVRQDPALAELRVQWLALEETSPAQAPAGYFQALPGRVLGKLPARPVKRHRVAPALWAAAAALMLTVGVGGFWVGKANRTPLVDARAQELEPAKEEPLADAPFQENDDVMVQIQNMSPEEIQRLAEKVRKGR